MSSSGYIPTGKTLVFAPWDLATGSGGSPGPWGVHPARKQAGLGDPLAVTVLFPGQYLRALFPEKTSLCPRAHRPLCRSSPRIWVACSFGTCPFPLKNVPECTSLWYVIYCSLKLPKNYCKLTSIPFKGQSGGTSFSNDLIVNTQPAISQDAVEGLILPKFQLA